MLSFGSKTNNNTTKWWILLNMEHITKKNFGMLLLLFVSFYIFILLLFFFFFFVFVSFFLLFLVQIMVDIGEPGSFSSIHIRARDFRTKVYSLFMLFFLLFFYFISPLMFIVMLFFFSLGIIVILSQKAGSKISELIIKTPLMRENMYIFQQTKKILKKLRYFFDLFFVYLTFCFVFIYLLFSAPPQEFQRQLEQEFLVKTFTIYDFFDRFNFDQGATNRRWEFWGESKINSGDGSFYL